DMDTISTNDELTTLTEPTPAIIYDLNGRVVLTQITQSELDVSVLPTGYYVLSFVSKGELQSVPFVKS
ncbi:MAG: T9SS type A sorting domain-containing protein, partial [Bacteroidota bacterium]